MATIIIRKQIIFFLLFLFNFVFGQLNKKDKKLKIGIELSISSIPKPTVNQIKGSMQLPLKSGFVGSFGLVGLKQMNKYSRLSFGFNSSFHFDYRAKGSMVSSNGDLLLENEFHFIEFNGVKLNTSINYLLNMFHSRNKNIMVYGKIGVTTSLNLSNNAGELITYYGYKKNDEMEHLAFYFHGYDIPQLFEFHPTCGVQFNLKNKFSIDLDVTYNSYTRIARFTIERISLDNEIIDKSTVSFQTKPYNLSLRLGYLF